MPIAKDEKTILIAIEEEATKLIKRDQRYLNELNDHLLRCEARSGVSRPKQILKPPYWKCFAGFNPYHVRKNAPKIARSIWAALSNRTYIPKPAAIFQLKKDGGGNREVSVFQVADQAIARSLFKRLL